MGVTRWYLDPGDPKCNSNVETGIKFSCDFDVIAQKLRRVTIREAVSAFARV